MLIGIKLTRAKSGPPQPSIFYCGLVAVDLRAAHAEELAKGEEGVRFYQSHNPLMFPLQSVPENTEDHPDQVAAKKRRSELAEKRAEASAPAAAAPIITIPVTAGSSELETENAELETITPEARRAELAVLKHADLRGIAEGIKNSGRPIALTTGTKAQLIEAILASEISTSGSDVPPAIESAI